MVASALSFLTGLILVQQISVLPEKKWLLVILLMSGIMAWMRYWRLLIMVMGLLWGILFANARLADRLSESLEGIDIPVRGVVSDLPEQDERRTRFDLIVTGSAHELPAKIRLSWYYPDQLVKAGQRWSFTVRLKRPHGSLNPGGFDYERWLFTEGIGATGYVRATPKPCLLGQTSSWTNIAVWRQYISDQLAQILNETASVALIKALTIGDGSAITQNQWNVFRKTGTTHLVVIKYLLKHIFY